MDVTERSNLREQPEIKRLFEILVENHLTKEQEQVESLVGYLDSMENQFGQVLSELKQVREQLEQIQDRGIRASVTRLIETSEGKVQEMGHQIAEIKSMMINAAKDAVCKFREKGLGALQKVVAVLKIPEMLSSMRECVCRCAVGMKYQAIKVEKIGREVQEVRVHRKNIGRLILGRAKIKPEMKNSDRGILAKIQRGFLETSNLFSKMEKGALQAEKRIQNFQSRETGKTSVKADLQAIKEKKVVKSTPAPIKQEKVR